MLVKAGSIMVFAFTIIDQCGGFNQERIPCFNKVQALEVVDVPTMIVVYACFQPIMHLVSDSPIFEKLVQVS